MLALGTACPLRSASSTSDSASSAGSDSGAETGVARVEPSDTVALPEAIESGLASVIESCRVDEEHGAIFGCGHREQQDLQRAILAHDASTAADILTGLASLEGQAGVRSEHAAAVLDAVLEAATDQWLREAVTPSLASWAERRLADPSPRLQRRIRGVVRVCVFSGQFESCLVKADARGATVFEATLQHAIEAGRLGMWPTLLAAAEQQKTRPDRRAQQLSAVMRGLLQIRGVSGDERETWCEWAHGQLQTGSAETLDGNAVRFLVRCRDPWTSRVVAELDAARAAGQLDALIIGALREPCPDHGGSQASGDRGCREVHGLLERCIADGDLDLSLRADAMHVLFAQRPDEATHTMARELSSREADALTMAANKVVEIMDEWERMRATGHQHGDE